MKRIALLLAALVALAGCATHKEFYAMQEKLLAQIKEIKLKDVELKIEQQRTRTAAMTAISASGKLDAGGAAAIGVTVGLAGQLGAGGQGQADPSSDLLKIIASQRPPESWDDKAFKWVQLGFGGLLQGYKVYADKELGGKQLESNAQIQTALYGMIERINRDTGAAVGAAGQRPASPPTYQITINDSQGVGILDGDGTYQGPLNLACSSATGPGGNGAPGGTSGTPTGSSGAGGSGAPSGSPPVTCTVTR